MLRAILNKSWRQHPTKQQLGCHLPPITKTIQVGRTRHTEHSWRSKEELISDVLQWTPSHERAKVGRLIKIYLQQLCANTGCSPEDLPGPMDDRDGWRERVREIHASMEWSREREEAPFPTPRCCSYWKKAIGLPLTTLGQLTIYMYIYKHTYSCVGVCVCVCVCVCVFNCWWHLNRTSCCTKHCQLPYS